jgi:YHS domain-containing protein
MNSRTIFIFIGTFVAGALIALIARASMFKPHGDHTGHPVGGGDYSAMVSNPLTPANPSGAKSAAQPTTSATNSAAPDPHAGHGKATTSLESTAPVNTVCAICGMDVDPKLETLEYQGKTIGFGCKLCAPKFKADPERYGPAYLKNEVIKR